VGRFLLMMSSNVNEPNCIWNDEKRIELRSQTKRRLNTEVEVEESKSSYILTELQ
jgi:hypothetical protein